MGYTKDLWFRPVKGPDGKPIKDDRGRTVKEKSSRHGKGKRWLACWLDPEGAERSQAFTTQGAADRHWRAMETDRDRGEYFDPRAGRVVFGDLGKRWLASRVVDPATLARYESAYRLHIEPTFGRRQVKGIRPSQVQAWVGELADRQAAGTVGTALFVLRSILDLAVADDAIKANPGKSPIVQAPKLPGREVQAWSDEQVHGIIDGHAALFRALPLIGAACGMRRGELFGLALEDVDFEEEVIRVRRQIKRLGKAYVYALPKNDRERTVPMPSWAAEAIRVHKEAYEPLVCSLPWERTDGKLRTHNLLFRWTDDRHIRANLYEKLVWKPALVKAGIIPPPTKDKWGAQKYAAGRDEGMHALRHYYASVMLADGVSIKELAEYLGHANAATTLKYYAHMLPTSHERARKAMDRRMFRPRVVAAGL
ncbi:MAG: tyrosine-type recombinase/integrase [Actinomadura sp.]